MKHWKITLILLVALLLLVLSACGERTNETTAPSDTGPSDNTTVYEDPIPDLSGDWYKGYEETIGNEYNGYLDGQILYRVNDEGALCTLDLTTLEESLVCAKEGCGHQKALCDAYFGREAYYLDGYLYRRSGDTLARCRLDGTEWTKLLTMGKVELGDRFYQNTLVESFQVTESAIYYTIRAEYGVDLGNYNFVRKTIYFLVRFDMESGEEEILGEFDGKSVNIMAARDDQVLIAAHEIVEVDFDDPDREKLWDNASVALQVWDEEYGRFVTVKEGVIETFNPWKIEDGKIIYTNYRDDTYHSYDPVTETDMVIERTEDRTVFGGKYVIIYDYDIRNNYLALAETGEKVHNDFGDLRMGICAHDDEGFIFKAEKIVYPEGEDYGEFVEQTTYYVRFADMEDGLHDYDCILLDHWEREE